MKRMSKEEKMAREELTKTQVLNLNDLKEVANYEKKTSKKPACILAVLGLLLITFGLSYDGIISSYSQNINKNNQPKKEEEIVENNTLSTISCQYKEPNLSGYDSVINMTFILKNNILTNFTKVMTISPSIENPDKNKITTLLSNYHGFDNLGIPGFTIASNELGEGFETVVNVDLKELDKTKLTLYHPLNIVTRIDFEYGDTKEDILNKGNQYGYVCK